MDRRRLPWAGGVLRRLHQRRRRAMAQHDSGKPPGKGIQVGIAALLVVIVVSLVGGIIWYNFEKSASLTIDTAERLLAASSEDTVHRIQLFYEPVLTILALASRIPQISEMTTREREDQTALVITGLRPYAQS